jgi:Flp pilus assembly protein TadD
VKRRVALAAALLAACALALADPEETDSGAAARDPDYVAGKLALERKDWPGAIKAFGRAGLREPDNADVQNLLGFAWRNTGKYEVAFKHYRRALELDPRHKGAHEYIGETYLKVGDLAGAEKHLAALRRLCPLSCEQLEDLEREVAEFRKSRR